MYAQYTIEVENREFFETRMKALGVPPAVHYPTGTSDLNFCDQLDKLGVWDDPRVKKAWPHLVGRKYKLAVDTRIRCGHLDRATGLVTVEGAAHGWRR